MKKAFVALMVVAMALVAQANVWNLNWTIMAALAPEDTTGEMEISLFENYDITWDLINGTSGETLATTSLVNGTLSWDDTENGGSLAKFDDFMIASSESTTYLGSTSLAAADGAQSIYQKITLVSTTGEQYVWQGPSVDVIPKGDGKDNPYDLGKNVVIAAEGLSFEGATMATWTKVAVPEPATMSLLGLGALAMMIRRRIRR